MSMVFSKEAKIGLVSIISLILLYVGINYLKGVNLFKPSNHYIVACSNVKGLTVSSPVYVEGFKVGLVRNIVYDYASVGKISVEISLEEGMKINKGSYIKIVNSFTSGGELHLQLNKYVTEYLPSGSTIEGRMDSDMMQALQEDVLPLVEVLLPKIDSILTGIQTLVNHPALAQSLDHIEKTTSNLAVTTSRLNRLLDKDVPVIMGDLKTVSGNFAAISSDLKSADLAATIKSVNATLNSVEAFTSRLNAKDNSIGLLLNDRSLYDNLNSTATNASNLLFDLKQNPKRYVHFSVF